MGRDNSRKFNLANLAICGMFVPSFELCNEVCFSFFFQFFCFPRKIKYTNNYQIRLNDISFKTFSVVIRAALKNFQKKISVREKSV